MSRKINPLLASPSPRDIDAVWQAHRKLDADFVYAKYFIEREAYWHLRNFFLKHEEYTHLVLAPDDLIIKPKDLKLLLQDLEEYDYPVLSGICNVDIETMRRYYDITENLPHPYRALIKLEDPERKRWWGYRWYAWMDMKAIKKEQKRQEAIVGDDRPPHHRGNIIRVYHSGFALQAIRRDVVQRINFITDAEANGIDYGETSSVDVMYSNTCAIDGIVINVDPRIKMLHLRKGGSVDITLGNPEIWHVTKDGTKYTYAIPKELQQPLMFQGMWDKMTPMSDDCKLEIIEPKNT